MMELKLKPTIGRIVHFTGKNKKTYAAIITDTTGVHWEVNLTVFNLNLQTYERDIPYSETPKPMHWNWPPRVDG
jgi:hypothetical protein